MWPKVLAHMKISLCIHINTSFFYFKSPELNFHTVLNMKQKLLIPNLLYTYSVLWTQKSFFVFKSWILGYYKSLNYFQIMVRNCKTVNISSKSDQKWVQEIFSKRCFYINIHWNVHVRHHFWPHLMPHKWNPMDPAVCFSSQFCLFLNQFSILIFFPLNLGAWIFFQIPSFYPTFPHKNGRSLKIVVKAALNSRVYS